MSGHNKWSKVKHKKAATDAKRSKLFSKHARLIAVEARASQGNKNSPGVRAAVERARADSMPNENIERAIQKGMGGEANGMEESIYETYGPGGVAVLITALTDNKNRTSQEIKHLLSKNGYALGAPGSALWAFTKTASGYTPTTRADLSESDGEALGDLIEILDEHDDVQDIFTTADESTTP